MSETIQPKCIFSPDEVLAIHVDRSDETRQTRQDTAIQSLSELPGVYIDGEMVNIPVRKALKPCLDIHSGDRRKLGEFLDDISLLVIGTGDQRSDKIFSPDWLGEHGFNGSVYPHFQRWLNTQTAMNPEVAKTAIGAMALPFGREYEKEARRVDVRGNHATAASGIFDYRIYPKESFGLVVSIETGDSIRELSGVVHWNWLSISTLGSCACLGVDGNDRSHIYMRNTRKSRPLYEMKPHNIDISPQSLSLLLTVGSLAYQASQYEGREDILKGAEWRRDESYPKS